MDTLTAFAMGQAFRHKPLMVFDWDKAARRIKQVKPDIAMAGLRGDWEYTGDIIYIDGKIKKQANAYLASTWAVPELNMDGDVEPCYIMQKETDWNAETVWPASARRILEQDESNT